MNSKFNISIFIELTIVNFIMPTTYETFVHNSLLNMYNAVDYSHISTLENNPIVTFSTNKPPIVPQAYRLKKHKTR